MTTQIVNGKTSGIDAAPMNEAEARAVVNNIREHLEQARELLYELYRREGWRALGYESWRSCVMSEFGRSESQLYRELAAARVEALLGAPIGSLPESYVRAVREVYDDDEQVAAILQDGQAHDLRTARGWGRFAREKWIEESLDEGSILVQRLQAGEVSVKDAFEIGKLLLDLDDYSPEINVIQLCSDGRLAQQLITVHKHLPGLWQEIAVTRSIPGLSENVPLEDASHRTLEAYINMDNTEYRGQYVEENKAYYDERRKARTEICRLARVVVNSGEEPDKLQVAIANLAEALDKLDRLEAEHG